MSDQTTEKEPVLWRPKQFKKDASLSDSQLWEWIGDGTIKSVKIGGCRFITESPTEWAARHAAPAT